jgi:hypothetical protein
MATNPAVVRATITAIQSLIERKEYGAAAKELGQLIAAGAHEGAEGHRVLALHDRIRLLYPYGVHSLTLEI